MRSPIQDRYFSHLAVAILPAIALLVIVHRAVLARLFATRFVGGETCRANHGRQNRKQDLRIIFHVISLVRDVIQRYRKNLDRSLRRGAAANRLKLSRVGRPDTLTVNGKLYLCSMRNAVC